MGSSELNIQSRIDKGEMPTARKNYRFDDQYRGLTNLRNPPGEVSVKYATLHFVWHSSAE